MGLFESLFRAPSPKKSATLAKERLQIIVAHERGSGRRGRPDYLPAIKKELLEVVRKYVPVDQNQIKVHLDREGGYEVLELNIPLPDEEPQSRRGPENQPGPGRG